MLESSGQLVQVRPHSQPKSSSELIKADIPFIVIDWEKSYRFLTKVHPDVEVYTVGNDDINPIHFNMLDIPPGAQG